MNESAVTQTSVMATGGSSNCTFPYSEDRVPLLTLYSAVLLVGLPSNLATVYLTLLQVRQRNVLGIYLLSLSVCDLTYLLTLPAWALYVNRNHDWPWNLLTCQVTGYIFFTNMYISIFLLCCISVDRYMAVVYAVESRGLRRQSRAALVMAAGCLAIGLAHIPVFTMPEVMATSASTRLCFEPSQSSPTVTGFNYARFSMGFLIPLVMLIVTNRAVLTSIQASATLRTNQKKHIGLMAVAVVTLFLVCFGPYHIILLIRAITYHFQWQLGVCHFERHVYTPYVISLGLSTVNSAANPILYILSSNNMRKEIRGCLAGLKEPTTFPGHSPDSSQHKVHTSDMLPTQTRTF